jgi:hypothetical protein
VSTFEVFARQIAPDPRFGVILFQEGTGEANLKQALSALAALGIDPVDHELLQPAYPAVVLVRLESEMVREAALKLSENGFTRLKAIAPAPHSRFISSISSGAGAVAPRRKRS